MSIVLKPIPIGQPNVWNRLQHIYWRALHVINDFPYFGPSRFTEPFDYMLGVKEEILRNKNARGLERELLLDDFEKHVLSRDVMPRRVKFFARGGPGYRGWDTYKYPADDVNVFPHGTPNPVQKVDYSDDGPVEWRF
eukprot:RCo013575